MTQEISRKRDRIVELFRNKLTIFEITEITGFEYDDVKQNILDAGIKLPQRDRKYRLIKTTPLTKEQKELITGCLLGKGHLMRHKRGCRFTAGHLTEEKDLLLWKKTILGNLSNVIVKHNKKEAYFFRTSVHHELNNYLKKFYDNNKKIIPEDISNIFTPLTLAAMISDIGWLNKTFNLRLETSKYTYQENQYLKHALKSFGLNSKICEFQRHGNKYYFISLNKRNSLNLYEIIKEYYPTAIRSCRPPVSQRLYA